MVPAAPVRGAGRPPRQRAGTAIRPAGDSTRTGIGFRYQGPLFHAYAESVLQLVEGVEAALFESLIPQAPEHLAGRRITPADQACRPFHRLCLVLLAHRHLHTPRFQAQFFAMARSGTVPGERHRVPLNTGIAAAWRAGPNGHNHGTFSPCGGRCRGGILARHRCLGKRRWRWRHLAEWARWLTRQEAP
jgi:hypothetical protein